MQEQDENHPVMSILCSRVFGKRMRAANYLNKKIINKNLLNRLKDIYYHEKNSVTFSKHPTSGYFKSTV